MRIALLAVSLVIAVTPGSARDRTVPAATPSGKAQDCVRLSQIRSTQVRSDQIIDFEMIGGQVYRNTLPNSCPRLGFEESFSYKTSINQLCSVDIITVLYASPLQSGASCGLGKFQPVTLAKRRMSSRR